MSVIYSFTLDSVVTSRQAALWMPKVYDKVDEQVPT